MEDVRQVLVGGSIVEEYPGDVRGPSCLVWGRAGGRDVHVVCGRNREDWLVIITVYLPLPPKWRTPRQRGGT